MRNYFKSGFRFVTAAFITLSALVSCTDYQDEINNLGKLYEDHEQRLKNLETLTDDFSSQLKSLAALVNAMEGGDYIKSVVPVENGYTIYFNKQSPVTITNGKNGSDGADGKTPDVSIRKDADGFYYWTLNGEWILSGGQKVRANGVDGEKGDKGDKGDQGDKGDKGDKGDSGTVGAVPLLRINASTNEWEVSADGGKTWTTTGTKATGPKGDPGEKGDKGDKGDGASGLFADVKLSEDGKTLILTMTDGTVYNIPIAQKEDEPVEPEEKYIWVGGNTIDSNNASSVGGTWLKKGKVSYDFETKILTLENVEIETTLNNVGIRSEVSGLTINVIGNCSIKSYATAVSAFAPMTITGAGVLKLEGSSAGIMMQTGSSVTISDVDVRVKGAWGITSRQGLDGYLKVEGTKTYLSAEGTSGSIADIGGLGLDGCKITVPESAVFDSFSGSVVVGEDVVNTLVEIKSVYDLSIGGDKVSADNAASITGPWLKGGSVSYEVASNSLVLTNTEIVSSSAGIVSSIENLKIRVNGKCSINSSGSAIQSAGSLNILGAGDLNLTSASGSGVALTENTSRLTVRGGKVNASGVYGVSGVADGLTYLTVTGSETEVTARGSSGSVVNIDALDLDGLVISTPEGAKFDAANRGIVKDGEIVTSKVVIGKKTTYDLWIGGVRVTAENASSITGSWLGGGSITYSAASNLLTLNSVTISLTDDSTIGIDSRIDGLKIYLSGTSSVTSKAQTMSVSGSVSLIGGGTLNLESEGCGVSLAANGAMFSVAKATVNVKGKWGVVGGKAYNAYLELSDAAGELSAEGAEGSIVDIGGLALADGCAITIPDGAVFDTARKAVVTSEGEVVKAKVRIGKK